MLKIIATDEAGYGPNLGPLVITATEWIAEYENSFPLFVKELETTGFTIGDSKKIYHSGGSLDKLKNVVLAALQTTSASRRTAENTHIGKINHSAVNKDIASVFESAKDKFGLQLVDVRSRIIEPKEFNELLDKYQSKGVLLSEATMQLVQYKNSGFKSDVFTAPVKVICDKHGGRNKYTALLQHYFPDEVFSIICESTAKSIYQNREGNLSFTFLAKGECETPVALSSMVSKYRRELAMQEFNAFWKQHIPELKPTAGYPEDAVRFQRDIKEKQIELGISNNEIWRKK